MNILSRCHLISVYGIHSSFSVIHKVGKAAIESVKQFSSSKGFVRKYHYVNEVVRLP